MYKIKINKKNNDVFECQKKNNYSDFLANFLARRNIKDKFPEKEEDLSDPYIFKDMKIMLDYLIPEIINNSKDIIVNTDYDNDGFTGGLIFLSFIKEKYGIELDVHINDKKTEGYELSPELVEKFHKKGKKIIFTIDKGISSYKGIDRAKELGMTVIITDHHQPKIKNNKKIISNADYHICHTIENFKMEISGAATAFYVCRAIDDEIAMRYIDLAGLANIVDIVPLLDRENRLLALKALDKIKSKDISIDSYKRFLNFLLNDKIDEITIMDFSFNIGPHVNAFCRNNRGSYFLKKFLRDEITDEDLKEIKKHNENRKLEVIEYVKELKKDIQEEENFIIAKSENINPALVGLIASKFESEYRKTTIVLFKDLKDNKYKGSGRTRSYNLQDFFTDKYKVKITGGGHEMAAGFDIDIDDYDLFVEELKNNVISETKIEVDGMIKNMNKVKLSHAKELSQLEPYGPPFFEPSFIFDLKNYKDIKLLKDIHLSMSNEKIKFINFNTDLNTVDINNLDNYYIIGSLNINKWMNRESLQIMVSNIIKKSDANIEKG